MEKSEQDYLDAIVLHIKLLRKKRHISQLELAHILGHKSPNYIAKIETRKQGANYNLHHLYAIAKAFALEPSELLPTLEEARALIESKACH